MQQLLIADEYNHNDDDITITLDGRNFPGVMLWVCEPLWHFQLCYIFHYFLWTGWIQFVEDLIDQPRNTTTETSLLEDIWICISKYSEQVHFSKPLHIFSTVFHCRTLQVYKCCIISLKVRRSTSTTSLSDSSVLLFINSRRSCHTLVTYAFFPGTDHIYAAKWHQPDRAALWRMSKRGYGKTTLLRSYNIYWGG